MSKTRCSFPDAVAIAEQFLWEVVHTDKWNYLFLGPHFPNQTNFCPRTRVWFPGSQIEGDDKLVEYGQVLDDGSIRNTAVVGVQRKSLDTFVHVWVPHSFRCDLYVFDETLDSRFGTKQVIIPPTKVLDLIELARSQAKNS